MTRINCVPVQELTDKHLGAEYRELPRIFGLAYAAYLRGEQPDDPRNPTEYTLGEGHVRFFYSRLWWCERRFLELVAECHRRGRVATYTGIPVMPRMPQSWWRDWHPTPAALAVNRARIRARLEGATT